MTATRCTGKTLKANGCDRDVDGCKFRQLCKFRQTFIIPPKETIGHDVLASPV